MAVIKLNDRGVAVGDILVYNADGIKSWLRPVDCISGVPSGYTAVGVCFHRDNDIAKVIHKSGGALKYKTEPNADTWSDGNKYQNIAYKKKTGLVTNKRGIMNIDNGYEYWKTSGGTPTENVPIINGPDDNPVNESSFNTSSYCKLLRQTYCDYRSYLKDNYGVKYPQTYGCFGLPDGKATTYQFNDSSHPAFQHCAGVSYPSDGIYAGDWWLPGVKEGVELMKDETLAVVNKSLALISGNQVSNSSNRWFAQKYSSTNAWGFGGNSSILLGIKCTSEVQVQVVTLMHV
jgi:hypothetical protein